ncbi:hypothetical protein DENSPDRAFT_883503 [Dentipellis sp. KUC8613]|nr:hypothetical protein DENSPDRAFT_883503 [Dentipellis sp. KUC8613]
MTRRCRLVTTVCLAFALTSLIALYTQMGAYYRPPFSTLELHDATAHDPQVLIVSAFYPLPKSKHPMSDYEAWLTHFLAPITSDIYMFAPPSMAPLIRRLRGGLPLTLNTSFASPFDIPLLQGRRGAYEEMHTRDRSPDRAKHSPDIYAVWNAKPYFLEQGLENALASGKHYDYAFWNDAGSFREDHYYEDWPDAGRVEKVYRESAKMSGTPIEEIIFFGLWWAPSEASTEVKEWRVEMGPPQYLMSEGSFFGGMQPAIRTYRYLYETYHDHWLANSFFVGVDQSLMNALMILFPSHFTATWIYDTFARAHEGVPDDAETQLGNCGSSWYYYQWWFAAENEREAMADRWFAETTRSAATMPKVRCRLTDVMTFDHFLTRAFGKDWRPPTVSRAVVKEDVSWLRHQ